MIVHTYCCDVCSKILPIEHKQTLFGKIEVVKTSKTKEWDTSMFLPHLCKGCALEIDNGILKSKFELMKTAEVRE